VVSRTGLIDHIGIGVPDLAAAKAYYDELMPILGLKQWFQTDGRAIVREAHEWARARGDEILHEPRIFPEYGPTQYATYWLDPHGIMLEAVCFEAGET
jgi:catechol 2,3-dioxygenase-like lactoylglutathione lyase family enzyme